MMRMEIEFDTEHIRKDEIVTEDMLFARVERVLGEVHIRKVDKGIYVDTGHPDNLTEFMAIMGWLMNAAWFRRYVKRWDWYNDRLGTLREMAPEDLLEGCMVCERW